MSSRRLVGFAVAFAACVCLTAALAMSQDKDKAPAGGMDEAAMMKAMMEAGATGPQHKALEPMAGKFTYTSKFKMDPSQDWMTSDGEYEGEMALGGRFLMTKVSGNMMGAPFTGMGCMGYDNVIKKFVSGWIDSMSTGIMRSEGTSDAAMKVFTFEGEMMDPMTRKPCAFKYAFEVKDNDHFTMRWWSPSMTDGKMFESMVIDYTRAN